MARDDRLRALLQDALALHQRGDLVSAEARYRQVLKADRTNVDTNHALGVLKGQQGEAEESVRLLVRAAKSMPGHAMVQMNYGNALRAAGRQSEAIAAFERSLAIEPRNARGWANKGLCQQDLGQIDVALASFDRALTLEPGATATWTFRGNAQITMNRFELAAASYAKALALAPNNADACTGLGLALLDLGRPDEARVHFEQSVKLVPEIEQAHFNLANALVDLGRLEEAVASLQRATALKQHSFRPENTLALTLATVCDWEASARVAERLAVHALDPGYDAAPFPLLSLFDDPRLQRQTAESYVRAHLPKPTLPPFRPAARSGDKLRICYLSGDFRLHAVSLLAVRLFEIHDRSKFEVIGVSVGPDDGSALRKRLVGGFDRFIEARELGPAALCQHIRDLQPNIVIDLNGLTKMTRMLALSERAAPIQVTYLGYAGTTGAAFIDYALVDGFVAPAGAEDFFTEKLVRLPDGFMPVSTSLDIGDPIATRPTSGLPETGFVFCSFNNSYKITRAVFDIWMRLLGKVPGSVLWLSSSNTWAEQNLRKEAEQRGIDPARLVFAAKVVDHTEHLARQRLADLFLDTWPYNAHTTASDALFAGLPVVTYAGRSFAARVAGSLLHAAGLPELVTETPEAFEALALRLARDPAELAALRSKLAASRATAPLFDMDRIRRNIESAYEEMWRIYQSGEVPRSFEVPPRS